MSQNLDPAYLERITKLAEECAEVIQVVTKIIRFGPQSSSPIPHELGQEANHILLEKEIADIFVVLEHLMQPAGDFNWEDIQRYRNIKLQKIDKYLLHNKVKIY